VWGRESEGSFSQEEAQSFSAIGQEKSPPDQKAKMGPVSATYIEIRRLRIE
jgi:hypothetical protein